MGLGLFGERRHEFYAGAQKLPRHFQKKLA
jgi:hypothetical protein